jgi:hypothetical protein
VDQNKCRHAKSDLSAVEELSSIRRVFWTNTLKLMTGLIGLSAS